MEMVATKAFTFGGRRYSPGERVVVKAIEAASLQFNGQAKFQVQGRALRAEEHEPEDLPEDDAEVMEPVEPNPYDTDVTPPADADDNGAVPEEATTRSGRRSRKYARRDLEAKS